MTADHRHLRVMKARNSMMTGTDRNTDPPAIAAPVLPTRATASEKKMAEMLIIAVVSRMAKARIRSAAPGSCRSYSPRMSGGGRGPDQARCHGGRGTNPELSGGLEALGPVPASDN
jgi:hypothetical protein